MPDGTHPHPVTMPSQNAGDDRPTVEHLGSQTADGARAPGESGLERAPTARPAADPPPGAHEEPPSPAEATFEDAERERRHAENRRGMAEQRREDAEQERVTSEQVRQIAEAARRAAEEAREEVRALRGAFDEQLAIMREMRHTLLALEARLAGRAAPPSGP